MEGDTMSWDKIIKDKYNGYDTLITDELDKYEIAEGTIYRSTIGVVKKGISTKDLKRDLKIDQQLIFVPREREERDN